MGVNLEVRLGEETTANVGNLIPVTNPESKASLQKEIRQLKGKTALVPSETVEWRDNRGASGEWQIRRLGAHPPEVLVNLRESVARGVVASCGVPVALLGDADGTLLREGIREFLHITIQPLERDSGHPSRGGMGRAPDVQL